MGESREWCLLAIICKTWPQHIWITHMHWNKARLSSLTWPNFYGMEWISECFRCFRLISLAMIHRRGNNVCHYSVKINVSKWTELLYWLNLDWTRDLFNILIISILLMLIPVWFIQIQCSGIDGVFMKVSFPNPPDSPCNILILIIFHPCSQVLYF